MASRVKAGDMALSRVGQCTFCLGEGIFGGTALAKRFTDTGKWDKAWFRKLPPELKCAWLFLCDRCDHAGIWEIDLDALQFFVGFRFSMANLTEAFGERLIVAAGNKILIEGFADFQYGNLNPENRVHKSILDRVEKLALKKGLKRSLKGPMDMDMEKEMEKDKEKEGAFEIFWAAYPRKIGKTAAKKAYSRSKLDPDSISKCLANYLAYLRREKIDSKFIQHGATFLNSCSDWLDPEHGKSESFADGGAIDWETLAKRVLDAIISAGGGSSAHHDRERVLGPELHAISIKAGIQRIRDVQRGPFQIKNIAQMLKDAAEVFSGSPQNEAM